MTPTREQVIQWSNEADDREANKGGDWYQHFSEIAFAAAAQAVIATVREDMERELRFECDSANIAGNVMLRLVQRLYRTPSDDTALREMLAEQWDKAAAEQREAAAKVVDRFISGDGELNEVWIHDITEAIRAMPLVIDK